jgi:hypothetical protein
MNTIFIDDTKDGKELNAWRNKMLRGAGFPVA